MIKHFPSTKIVDVFIIILFSFSINKFYGSIGVLAQDTFAYYDTGFRILQGSVPFKDYWTVSGPIIDYFQAFLFYTFGISWKSYILNGSIINVALSLLLYKVFLEYNLNRFLNLFYTLSFALLANPSMGVPFTDHYSAFFSVSAILLFFYLIKQPEKNLWFLIPVLFFIAFFSKQTPATYLLSVFLIVLIIYLYFSKNLYLIKIFFISSLSCTVFAITFIITFDINFYDFFEQYFLFPQTIGASRLEKYNFTINNTLSNFKILYLVLFFVIINIFLQFLNKKEKIEYNKFIINILLLLLTFTLIFHQLLTKNFIFIFFLIPLIAGFMHINFLKQKKYALVSLFLIGLTLFSTVKYHLRFNEHRKMLNLENINLEKAIDSKSIDISLKGLKWITSTYPLNPEKEIKLIKDSIEIIKKDETTKVMLYTDYLFLSSILQKDLNSPTRWPSLGDASNPSFESKYYLNYLKFVENLTQKKGVEVVYSTIVNKNDVFIKIFTQSCRKTELINEILTKHDIRSCKILK